MNKRVYSLFQQSVEAKMQVGEELAPLITQASEIIVQALLQEKKILLFGNGMSAAIAQVFTSALLDRYEKERPGLPAIWLGSTIPAYTANADDYNHNEVIAKPVRALAQQGDVLISISNNGNTNNLVQAAIAAHDRGASVISLTGREGGNMASVIDSNDLEICVPLDSRGRIHEIHLLCVFCLCDLIDHQLFGIE